MQLHTRTKMIRTVKKKLITNSEIPHGLQIFNKINTQQHTGINLLYLLNFDKNIFSRFSLGCWVGVCICYFPYELKKHGKHS